MNIKIFEILRPEQSGDAERARVLDTALQQLEARAEQVLSRVAPQMESPLKKTIFHLAWSPDSLPTPLVSSPRNPSLSSFNTITTRFRFTGDNSLIGILGHAPGHSEQCTALEELHQSIISGLGRSFVRIGSPSRCSGRRSSTSVPRSAGRGSRHPDGLLPRRGQRSINSNLFRSS